MKVCSKCHAVHNGKRWNGAHEISRRKLEEMEKTLCTACKRMRDKVALGTVHLNGEVIVLRKDEIMRMIRREEEIEKSRNHCSQILDVKCDGQKMTVQTVNSLLAIHIAKQFKKAFKGRMEIYKDTPGHRPRNKDTEGTVSVKWIQNP